MTDHEMQADAGGFEIEQQPIDDEPRDRSTTCGSADVPAILGLDRYRSPLTVWREKMGEAEPGGGESAAIYWGRKLEPLIVAEVGQAHSREFGVWYPGITATGREPWQKATPDGYLTGEGDDAVTVLVPPANQPPPDSGRISLGVLGTIEAKQTGERLAYRWEDGPPANVVAQARWQLALTNAPLGAIIAVLIGGKDFRTFWVTRDREAEREIVEHVSKWWHEHIIGAKMPEIDASKATTEWLAKRFPANHEPMKAATPAIEAAGAALAEARHALAQLQLAKTHHENVLKFFIGNAEGVEGGFGTITWRKAASGGTDYKRLIADLGVSAEKIAEYAREGSRRFVPTFRDEQVEVREWANVKRWLEEGPE